MGGRIEIDLLEDIIIIIMILYFSIGFNGIFQRVFKAIYVLLSFLRKSKPCMLIYLVSEVPRKRTSMH